MLKGLSIGEKMDTRIKEGNFTGYLHSAFEKVWNLSTSDGELYVVALPEIGNSTNALLVNRMPDITIKKAVKFNSIGLSLLKVGNEFINLSDAQVWTPIKDFEYIELAKIKQNFAILGREIIRLKHFIGLGEIVGGLEPSTNISETVLSVIPLLCKGIKQCDTLSMATGVRKIIGLGPGLTPSGDDFLTGYIYSTYRGFEAMGLNTQDIMQAFQAILVDLKSRTNLISYTQILNATRGEGPEKIDTLQYYLYCNSDEKRLLNSINEVLKIGHSSGVDLIAGMVAAMDSVSKDTFM